MLDLESLATGPDAVVLTLGAIKFDPFDADREINQALYVRVDVDEQLALGRRYNDETLSWWNTQPEDVREEALGESDRISLDDFTRQLNKFIVGADRIWAQGPVFDIAMLENLYRQIGKPAPWDFYRIRDCRTLLKALGDTRPPGRDQLHHALADCVYQAQAIQHVVKKYNLSQL